MKSSIFFKLQLGFGISVFILFISSASSYISIKKLIESNNTLKYTNEIRFNLENAISYLKDAETGQRGYLLTHDKEFLTTYKGSYLQVTENYEKALSLIQDDSVKKSMIELKTRLIERFDGLENTLRIDSLDQLNNTSKELVTIDLLTALKKGKRIMDETRVIINKIEERQKYLLVSRTQEQEKYFFIRHYLL